MLGHMTRAFVSFIYFFLFVFLLIVCLVFILLCYNWLLCIPKCYLTERKWVDNLLLKLAIRADAVRKKVVAHSKKSFHLDWCVFVQTCYSFCPWSNLSIISFKSVFFKNHFSVIKKLSLIDLTSLQAFENLITICKVSKIRNYVFVNLTNNLI